LENDITVDLKDLGPEDGRSMELAQESVQLKEKIFTFVFF
jgi:hypothetical protein